MNPKLGPVWILFSSFNPGGPDTPLYYLSLRGPKVITNNKDGNHRWDCECVTDCSKMVVSEPHTGYFANTERFYKLPPHIDTWSREYMSSAKKWTMSDGKRSTFEKFVSELVPSLNRHLVGIVTDYCDVVDSSEQTQLRHLWVRRNPESGSCDKTRVWHGRQAHAAAGFKPVELCLDLLCDIVK